MLALRHVSYRIINIPVDIRRKMKDMKRRKVEI